FFMPASGCISRCGRSGMRNSNEGHTNMNADCQWFEQHLEDLFCDRLQAEDERRARSHIETCPQCHTSVQQLESIDPLVRNLFRQNLAMARQPRRRRSPIVIGSVATAAAAFALLVGVNVFQHIPTPPVIPPAAEVNEPSVTPSVPKVEENSAVER